MARNTVDLRRDHRMSLKDMDLRSLRLWHWRKVLALRSVAAAHEAHADQWEQMHPGRPCRHSRSRARSYHRQANFHIGAVQALNDVVSGTAEQDAAP